MKKIFLFLFILLFSKAKPLLAQKNVIKLNPLSLAVSNLSMFYERSLSSKMTFQLGVNYMNQTSDNDDGINPTFSITDKLNGFGITPELRYYLTASDKVPPRGLFIGPYFRYLSLKFTTKLEDTQDPSLNDESETQVTNMQFGLIGGYQFLFKDRFALDIFGGPNYQIADV